MKLLQGFLAVCCLFSLSILADDYPLRDAVECRDRDGLPNFFQKLDEGKSVKIGYLGGSITAQNGWRPKTLDWFRAQYPKAEINEIHAAIGGTGSDLGVFRLRQDVLDHKPDLLFIEFAVNDGGAPPHRIHQAMEGIVRQTIQNDPTTDICFVYTLVGDWTKTLRDGKFPRAASAMEAIADHYGIPSIHIGLQVAILEGEGKLIFKGEKPKTEDEKETLGDKILFSPDNVHPYTDSGHELYLQAVVRGMKTIRQAGKPGAHTMPKSFVDDHWQAAKMIPLSKVTLSPGWERLDPEENSIAKRFSNRMPAMYFTNKPGERIQFQFKGTGLRIYDLVGPDCGQVNVRIDNQPTVLKPRFDSYCTYHRLASFTIAENLPDTVHTVKMELHSEQPDKAAILSTRNNKIDKPERYDDTAWYVGAVLVLGDIVEGLPPVQAVTCGPGHHWFGYYDKWQFDPSNRYLLDMKVNFEGRSPKADDVIDIGMIDLLDGNRWIHLGQSRSWGWQQGCMLQWRPGSKSEIVWNDREGDRFVCRIMDVFTRKVRTIPYPVYTLSPDGKTAVTPDFRRIQDTRPGYGYAGLPDPHKDVPAPGDSGIWRVNLDSGEAELIITLADIVKIPHKHGEPGELESAKHWFNHLLFNTDGTRFIFLHRWRQPDNGKYKSVGGFGTRMLTSDIDGKNIRIVDPYGKTSHFIWRDPSHILAWAWHPSKGNAFYLYEDGADNVEIVGEGVMIRNGHCTYLPLPENEWILNDAYPDQDRNQNVYLYHIPNNKRIPLGRFYSPKEYKGEWRVDTHPRFSRDGNQVVIDSPHGGNGRQQYLIDISGIIGK